MPSTMIRMAGAELLIDHDGHGEPALVFLHYWGGSSRTWAPVVARLPVGTRSIVVNQRGWGGSRSIAGGDVVAAGAAGGGAG